MAITFNKETKTFYLDGKGITYAFMINDFDVAEHLYYGKTIAHDDLSYTTGQIGCHAAIASIPGKNGNLGYYGFKPELSFFGTGDYREPTVQVTNPEGGRT